MLASTAVEEAHIYICILIFIIYNMSQSKCPVTPTRVGSLAWTKPEQNWLDKMWLDPGVGKFNISSFYHEIMVSGDALTLYLFEFEDSTFKFALIWDGMSIIMTVVTSRRDVGFTMCSYQCPRIAVGSALILIHSDIVFVLPGAF